MYGTVARTRVKPENRDKLREVIQRQSYEGVAGFVAGYVLWENEGDGAWIVAVFEDRAAYEKNADDPGQHERYLEYRALLDEEPEWHDGQVEKS
jgi:quinol monooxygenase YgiN